MVGVSKDTVYKWADGTNAPTYDTIILLKRLGVTDFELYGEVFQSQEDEIRKKAAGALVRFMAEMGINVDSMKEMKL